MLIAGLTQTQIGERFNLSQSVISKVLVGMGLGSGKRIRRANIRPKDYRGGKVVEFYTGPIESTGYHPHLGTLAELVELLPKALQGIAASSEIQEEAVVLANEHFRLEVRVKRVELS